MQLNTPNPGAISSCLVELAASIPRWRAISTGEERVNGQALSDMVSGPFQAIFDQLKGVFSEFGEMAAEIQAFFDMSAEGMMNQMFNQFMEDPLRLGGFMTNLENTFGQFRQLGTQQANEILRSIDTIKKAFLFHKPESLLGIVLFAVSNGFTSIYAHEKLLKSIRTGIKKNSDIIRKGGRPDKINPVNPFKEAINSLCNAKASLARVSQSASAGEGFDSGACGEGVSHLGNARQALQSGRNSTKFIEDVVKSNLAELRDFAVEVALPEYHLKLNQEALLLLMGPLGKTSNDIWNLHSNLSQSISNLAININLDDYFAIIMQFLISEIERIEALLRRAVGDFKGEQQALENQIQQKLALLGQVGRNAGMARENATIATQIQLSSSTPRSAAATEKRLRSLGVDPGWTMADLNDDQRAEVEKEFRQTRSAYIDDASTEAAQKSHLSSRERQEQLILEIQSLRQEQRVSVQNEQRFSSDGASARELFGVLQVHLEAFIQIAMLQAMSRAVCRGYRLFDRLMKNLSKFNASSLIGKLNKVLEDLDPSNCPPFWGANLMCNLAHYQTVFSRVMSGRANESQLLELSRIIESDISKQQRYISCLKEKLGVAKGEFLAALAAIGATLQIAALIMNGFSIEKLLKMLGLDISGLFSGQNMSVYEAILSALSCILNSCDNPGIQVACRRVMAEVEAEGERERTRYLSPASAAMEARNANNYPTSGTRFRLAAVTRLIDMIQNFQVTLCAKSSDAVDGTDTQDKSETKSNNIEDIKCGREPGKQHVPDKGDNKSLVEDEKMAKKLLDAQGKAGIK